MSSKITDYSYVYYIAHGLGHFITVLARDLKQKTNSFEPFQLQYK